ncbi:MAG: HAD family hydrolase [Elusimicrobiales bacterium]
MKAVFLDRDGTLIHDRPGHYLSRPEDMRVYKGAPEALAKLSARGFKLFIVSNQSGIGRGYFSRAAAVRINRRLEKILAAAGAEITETAFCPHSPQDGCPCRKPSPEMGKRLVKKYKIDVAASFMVGDKLIDAEFGKRLGVRTVMLGTGHGASQAAKSGVKPDHRARNIISAVNWILKNEIQD